MIKLIITLIFYHTILLLCQEDCLKCSFDNQCLFCNPFKFKLLSAGSCKLNQIENCQKMDLLGSCLQCQEKTFFLLSTLKCQKVDTLHFVENCLFYDQAQNCQFCHSDFYIKENKCERNTTKLFNCLFYSSKDFCQECEKNFYLNHKGECVKFPEINNCVFFTDKKCNVCSEGYFPQQNQSKILLDFKSLIFRNFLNNFLSKEKFFHNPEFCFSFSDQNCMEFNKTCSKCKTGFFLNPNFLCEQIPKNPIQFCEDYLNETTCSKCLQGYLKINSQSCVIIQENQKIQNCELYDSAQQEIKCQECQPEFYLKEQNCYVRKFFQIENCLILSKVTDLCSYCKPDYILSQSKLNCLKNIPFCLEIQQFQNKLLEWQVVCKQCNEGFYLDEQYKCQTGRIENCSQYSHKGLNCVVCKNEFYLKNGFCFSHLILENCEKYDNLFPNVCFQCKQNYALLNIKKKCVSFNYIPYCKEYFFESVSYQRCVKCIQGYFISTSGNCSKITIENCIELDNLNNNSCSKCSTNYGLLKNPENNLLFICSKPFDFQSTQCQKFYDFSDDNYFEARCEICKENTIPLYSDFEKQICIESDKKYDIIQKEVNLDHCLVASKQSCLFCEFPYFLQYNNGWSCNLCGENEVPVYHYASCVGNSPCSFIVPFCASTAYKRSLFFTFSNSESNIILKGSNKCVDDGYMVSFLWDWIYGGLYSNMNPANFGKLDTIDDFRDSYYFVDCPDFNSEVTIDDLTYYSKPDLLTLYTGFVCPYFYEFFYQMYACASCPWGQAKKAGSADKYIKECEIMPDCDANVKFRGIGGNWYHFISCHACKQQNHAVVIAFKAIDKRLHYFQDFSNFSLEIYDWLSATDNFSQHIFCMENTVQGIKQKLKIPIENNNVFIIPNCAAYFLNLIYSGSFDNSEIQGEPFGSISKKQALLCLHCLPGYKKTLFFGVYYYLVYAADCIRIEHCAQSDWVNYCSQCEVGYIWEYDLLMQTVRYDSCVKIPDDLKNCHIFDGVNQKCVQCQKGFILTQEFYCFKVFIPNCAKGIFGGVSDNLKKIQNLRYTLYSLENTEGCSVCNEGFMSIQQGTNQSICMKVDIDFQKPYERNSVSSLVKNCKLYYTFTDQIWDQQIPLYNCYECLDGFILSVNMKQCIKQDLIPNCKIFEESSTNCYQCQKNYTLNNLKKCVLFQIANCLEYFENIPQDKENCKKCNSKFVWINNECKQGNIENCEFYLDGENCEKCFVGFLLIKKSYVNSTSDFCVNEDESLNCKKVKFQNTGYLQYFCEECKTDQFQFMTLNENFQITSCLKYNKNQNIHIISICSQNEFFDSLTLICKSRTVLFDTCQEYELTLDLCKFCKKGFYLSNSKKECILNPQGIQNCYNYLQINKCQVCSENYYLKEFCVPLKEDEKIQNCFLHTSPKICYQCKPNYFLKENQCLEFKIQNCEIPLNENSCKICKQGFVIEQIESKRECVNFEIQNCLILDQEFKNCSQCLKNFFVNGNGKCDMGNLIDNCNVLLSKEECKYCQKGFMLDQDKKSCIQGGTDKNCENMEILQDLECSLCESGFENFEGRCKWVGNLFEGCLVKDLQNECFICQPSYYMDNKGTCRQIQALVGGSINQGDLMKVYGFIVGLFGMSLI